MWDLSVKIAKLFKDKTIDEIEKMSKEEMFQLTNEVFLLNYDKPSGPYLTPEEETYKYFQTLVKFNHTIQCHKEKENDAK